MEIEIEIFLVLYCCKDLIEVLHHLMNGTLHL